MEVRRLQAPLTASDDVVSHIASTVHKPEINFEDGPHVLIVGAEGRRGGFRVLDRYANAWPTLSAPANQEY